MHISYSIMQDELVFLHIIALTYAGYAVVHDFFQGDNEIDIESLATKSSQQVREELIKIKGIGHWTIDIYLMFSLQVPDIIPLGDIAVINTIKKINVYIT